MRSRLYEGTVWHERRDPSYRLEHRVFYLDLDLAEADLLPNRLPIFSHNSFNLLSIRDSDYEVLETASGRPRVDIPGDAESRTSIVTIPRIMGYVFNPVSFFLVRDSARALSHVVAEVHNTWGERHVYDLARSDDGGVYRSTVAKDFYVSPFLAENASYQFEVEEEAGGLLRILVNETTAEGDVFAAGLTLEPKELSTSSLLGALVRYPFVNLKVIGAIHWHAARLWLRGAKFHPHTKQKPSSQEAEQ